MSDPNDREEIAERLTELEIRYSHQEHLLQELSDVLRDQQETIDRLVRAVRTLQETAPEEGAPPHEKPPHY